MTPEDAFRQACQDVLDSCPIDTAKEFARSGLEGLERQVASESLQRLAQFMGYECRTWHYPAGGVLRQLGREWRAMDYPEGRGSAYTPISRSFNDTP